MRRIPFLALAVTTAVVACSSSGEYQTDVTPQPFVVTQPAPVIEDISTLPPGTAVRVILTQPIGLDGSKAGDRFYAMVAQPVSTKYGEVIVPSGATVSGVITALPDADNPNVRVSFDQMSFGGRTRLFVADVVNPQASWPKGSLITLKTVRELSVR